MLGLLPYDCAAIYFGTTIGDMEQFDELTEDAVALTVSIVGLVLAVGMSVGVGCLAKRKMAELTDAAEARAGSEPEPEPEETRP